VVDYVPSELKLGPAILVEWGKEDVKLCLSETDNFSSGFFSKYFKVKLSSGMESFDGGLGSDWGWGADNVGVWVDRGGLEGVWVDKDDTGISKQGRVYGGLGGDEEREARDNELRAGSNGG